MYTTNALLNHPLVSPVMQATLGGLPPLLIIVGGGEILRDEQIHLAHKCANPTKYAPPPEELSDRDRELLQKYKPTNVQLQVWDDLCHVAPTLSFTRPAKFMYRSIAQFGAWALARAQKRGIEILDDDEISVISNSGSDVSGAENEKQSSAERQAIEHAEPGQVGKAGDPLPPFRRHMIRQRVTRHGVALPLAPESELPGCGMEPCDVGVVKEATLKRWLERRKQWDRRFTSAKVKVHRRIIKDMVKGFQDAGPEEHPPPTALAGRLLIEADVMDRKKTRGFGLALWSLLGSRHDELTVEREKEADNTAGSGQGERRTNTNPGGESSQAIPHEGDADGNRPRSHSRTVTNENQIKGDDVTNSNDLDDKTAVAQLIELRKDQEASHPGLLSPNYVPETGVAGKRPFIGGIALPFSLNKDADTASMVTLNSATNSALNPRPLSPLGSRMDLSGNPEPDDEARAEQLLAAGTSQPVAPNVL